MRDFGFDLLSELVGSTAEFGEQTSRLTGDLRQLLRPKDDQGEEEQKDRLGKTHGFIIMRRAEGDNAALEPQLPHGASRNKRRSRRVTDGDYPGPEQSNLVIYCVYSAR